MELDTGDLGSGRTPPHKKNAKKKKKKKKKDKSRFQREPPRTSNNGVISSSIDSYRLLHTVVGLPPCLVPGSLYVCGQGAT